MEARKSLLSMFNEPSVQELEDVNDNPFFEQLRMRDPSVVSETSSNTSINHINDNEIKN